MAGGWRLAAGGWRLMLLFSHDELPDLGDAVPLSRLDARDMVGLTTSGPVGDALTNASQRHGAVIHEVVANQTFYSPPR